MTHIKVYQDQERGEVTIFYRRPGERKRRIDITLDPLSFNDVDAVEPVDDRWDSEGGRISDRD